MNLKLSAFGIAKDIIAASSMRVSIDQAQTVGDVKKYLMESYPAFKELLKFSLAVEDEYRDDDFRLTEGDEIIIIPPVSGG